ncbi:MAG: DUF29 family protein [Bryobacterales bacterium]|nr:DUF29 family protein [Bryobacterales bacterium]
MIRLGVIRQWIPPGFTIGISMSGRCGMPNCYAIAEELEDMGKRERRALRSRLSVLLAHLLKWQAQP